MERSSARPAEAGILGKPPLELPSKSPPRHDVGRLRAGHLSAELVGIDLWNIRFHGIDIAQRIYLGVRDRNWDTIPGRLLDRTIDVGAKEFRVALTVEHDHFDVRLRWKIAIAGHASGQLRYAIDGEARSAFHYCRIGLCVLHGIEGVAGRACTIIHGDGSVEDSQFPLLVSPRQPFLNIREIRTNPAPTMHAALSFEGAEFEMEDHRNWTDASFKTYSHPMRAGSPRTAAKGERFHQSVAIDLEANAPPAPSARAPKRDQAVLLFIMPGSGRQCPGIGSILSDDSLGNSQAARLRSLGLSHLRADLRPPAGGWGRSIERCADASRRIGAPMEVAVHLGDDAEAELACLASEIARHRPTVRRWIVLRKGERATGAAWVSLARRFLQPVTPLAEFGTGTDEWFAQVNRAWPLMKNIDFISFPICPQVHGTDDRTLIGNLEGQVWPVLTARAFADDAKIAVSPISLKPRFNPLLTKPYPHDPQALESNVDSRQATLLAAGWTVMTIANLAHAGATSLTLFETTGQRGLMTGDGQPLPRGFPAKSGDVYPLFHVLADIPSTMATTILPIDSTKPRIIGALGFHTQEGHRLIVANLTSEVQQVRIASLDAPCVVRVLDGDTLRRSMSDPESFRARARTLPSRNGAARLELGPWAVARIDCGMRTGRATKRGSGR